MSRIARREAFAKQGRPSWTAHLSNSDTIEHQPNYRPRASIRRRRWFPGLGGPPDRQGPPAGFGANRAGRPPVRVCEARRGHREARYGGPPVRPRGLSPADRSALLLSDGHDGDRPGDRPPPEGENARLGRRRPSISATSDGMGRPDPVSRTRGRAESPPRVGRPRARRCDSQSPAGSQVRATGPDRTLGGIIDNNPRGRRRGAAKKCRGVP